MKKSKIFLTMMITVFLLMLGGSLNVFALTEGDWEFQLLDNEVMITGYIGDDADVVVPDTIYGYPVTSMEMNEEKNLQHAISVKFPSHLKVLNNTIFKAGLYTNSKTIENIILPEGLERIDDSAFYRCSNLKNVNIPSTLKSIGASAFCESVIEELRLPVGIENIGDAAFRNCKALKSIQLPENMKKIGDSCFQGAGIVEIYLPFVENLGDEGIFRDCIDLQYVTIASGYKSLPSDPWPQGMFEDCISLTGVYLPNTIEEIDGDSFSGCSSLSQIILPSSLKKIHGGAFKGTSLKEIVIPYGTTSIGTGAFGENEALKSVYIPDTVTDFSGNILSDSPNAIIYCAVDSYAAKYCKDNKISHLTDNSVNSGITVLYNGTRISFHSYGQNPELLNSRTLVPLRSIFEAMGAEVEWDGTTSTAVAKRDGVEVKIQIGANEMYKDGKPISVDVPAMLLNDRTMVPVRVIAEAFGADVQWNGNGRTVLITE